MKTLVVIFGPPAVGKMAVGLELARLTGLRLFHNHMTIDLVLPFFEFGTPPFKKLVNEFRRRIFEEVANSDLTGLIFTYVWALDEPGDKRFIDDLADIFERKEGSAHFVELEAELQERLRRNETELRLAEKPSKRDLERSRRNLLRDEETYRMNTADDFFYPDRHLKIDNTALLPEEAAGLIVERFSLPRIEMEGLSKS